MVCLRWFSGSKPTFQAFQDDPKGAWFTMIFPDLNGLGKSHGGLLEHLLFSIFSSFHPWFTNYFNGDVPVCKLSKYHMANPLEYPHSIPKSLLLLVQQRESSATVSWYTYDIHLYSLLSHDNPMITPWESHEIPMTYQSLPVKTTWTEMSSRTQ